MSNQQQQQLWARGMCQCCDEMDLTCYVCWCPCLAYKEAAENLGNDGILYCLMTFPCCCGCCVLTVLGEETAKRRNIDVGLPSSALCACLSPCTCYGCTVVHETRLFRESHSIPANNGVKQQEMKR
mgnify:CR=1 FL=1